MPYQAIRYQLFFFCLLLLNRAFSPRIHTHTDTHTDITTISGTGICVDRNCTATLTHGQQPIIGIKYETEFFGPVVLIEEKSSKFKRNKHPIARSRFLYTHFSPIKSDFCFHMKYSRGISYCTSNIIYLLLFRFFFCLLFVSLMDTSTLIFLFWLFCVKPIFRAATGSLICTDFWLFCFIQ